MAAQHDRRDDDRHHESDFCRALFHARALQRTSGLGDCGVGPVLASDTVRADVQRLLDTRLAFDRILVLTRQVEALFPAPRSIAYTKGSANEGSRLKS